MGDNPYAPPPGNSPPPGYGPPPGYAAGHPPYAQPGADSAPGAMAAAASRAGAASIVLWVSTPFWLLSVAAGFAALQVPGALEDDDFSRAVDAAAGTDVLNGLWVLFTLGFGAAVWALLALWSSWTARAARAAGRGQEVRASHLGWWGLFVPVGGLVLPVLAYAQAARFIDAARNSRRGQVPGLLIAWWVLAMGAVVLRFITTATFDEVTLFGSGDVDRYGALLIGGGALGLASGVVGALALRALARTAREAAR